MGKQLKLLVICAAVVGSIVSLVTESPRKLSETPDPLITCVRHSIQPYSISATLRITIEGEDLAIPANIGITSGCTKPLHTDTAAGTIHVIAREKPRYTLKDFFAVWDKPFTEKQILNFVSDTAEHHVVLYVNGVPNVDFENYVIQDGDELRISYEHR
jgi:hypothetical protein